VMANLEVHVARIPAGRARVERFVVSSLVLSPGYDWA
jgi:hypothetical protein